MVDFQGGGEWLQGPFEDTQGVSDGQAVVGDRHPRPMALQQPGEHFAPVHHASPAGNDDFAGGEIFGKIVPLDGLEL